MPDDDEYLRIVLAPIRISAGYQPKFGQGGDGLSLEEFRRLYRSDPFYGWFGLDSPLLYAAHKAAGGMTSVYRQIGIGCERLFRAILRDCFGLSEEDAKWSYEVSAAGGGSRELHLDGRVPLSGIQDKAARKRFRAWMRNAAKAAQIDAAVSKTLKGAVFEVRQGYKSKDSKRQNADLSNAAAAYTQAYLPCAAVLSMQADLDVLARYREHKWTVLTGAVGMSDPLSSTYDFMREVAGYDLAGFFRRNQEILKSETTSILRRLLEPA